MPNNARPTSESGDTGDGLFAATRLFEPDEMFTRQEEDIAFAAELLRSGFVNDRELLAAISDWSLHGSVPLAKHIEEKNLLSAEQIAALRRLATSRVDRARHSVAAGSEAHTGGASMLLATLERLDGSGRVAKLFGVTVAAQGGGNDARAMQGRFEIVRKLGQGGLGRVWLARDVHLNRHVALKEISHASESSPAVVERFKREAEITGRLDHPSIVPIYQLGEDLTTGRAFYTMRFLGKATLQDAINEYHERREEGDDDPMLLRHLLSSFVNCCHAVGHAHSRKVIHRDLKPENVVIDSFGQVIVIDWGLAKVIDDTSVECLMDAVGAGGADRTGEGQVLGTPLYMSPEQAAGRLDELDQRTDIYGLGAILFAIITGYAPHEKTQKEAVDSGVGQRGMISAIASGAAPAARELNRHVDPALDAICRKAMARRQYARYQSALELAEDVQRWMAGEPVTAFRGTTGQRVNRWISLHPRLFHSLMATATIVLVALTTLAMSSYRNRVAAAHARYTRMNSDIRELEVHLRGIAVELAKDVRFLAGLPPVQDIIDATDGADDKNGHQRLEQIFEGLLRSNSAYLALSFESSSGEGAADVVRVERNPADATLLRIVPASRLRIVNNDSLMSAVRTLEPGDVKLSLETRTRHAEMPGNSNRLSIATPVYSEATGKLFGMAVIESDISSRIMDVLRGLGAVDYEMFVGDGQGHLWASIDLSRGVRLAGINENIPGLPEAVGTRISIAKDEFELQGNDQFVAKRFYVDPNGRGILVFARLPED